MPNVIHSPNILNCYFRFSRNSAACPMFPTEKSVVHFLQRKKTRSLPKNAFLDALAQVFRNRLHSRKKFASEMECVSDPSNNIVGAPSKDKKQVSSEVKLCTFGVLPINAQVPYARSSGSERRMHFYFSGRKRDGSNSSTEFVCLKKSL